MLILPKAPRFATFLNSLLAGSSEITISHNSIVIFSWSNPFNSLELYTFTWSLNFIRVYKLDTICHEDDDGSCLLLKFFFWEGTYHDTIYAVNWLALNDLHQFKSNLAPLDCANIPWNLDIPLSLSKCILGFPFHKNTNFAWLAFKTVITKR